ncbi:MAG TPA: DUF4440 domain-containing protein [Woeseiaceae bacterium]|nr:DUF4440 domain-containing protein [Woeseiaceae bacterium]
MSFFISDKKARWPGRVARTVFLTLLVTGCTSETPTFDSTLKRHIEAITQRDLSAYISTITERQDLTVIFPDGSRLSTREQVIDFHRTWFADPEWRMDIEEVWRLVSNDFAVVLLRTAYRDTAAGEPRYAWLSMSFAKEKGSWRLVFDQNTRILDNDAEVSE